MRFRARTQVAGVLVPSMVTLPCTTTRHGPLVDSIQQLPYLSGATFMLGSGTEACAPAQTPLHHHVAQTSHHLEFSIRIPPSIRAQMAQPPIPENQGKSADR